MKAGKNKKDVAYRHIENNDELVEMYTTGCWEYLKQNKKISQYVWANMQEDKNHPKNYSLAVFAGFGFPDEYNLDLVN